MTKEEIKNFLLKFIDWHKDDDGWTPLPKIETPLKSVGIDFNQMGYNTLFDFIQDNKDCLVWTFRDGNASSEKEIFIRDKSKKLLQPQLKEPISNLKEGQKKRESSKREPLARKGNEYEFSRPGDSLQQWALMIKSFRANLWHKMKELRARTYSELEQKVLKGERWSYDHNPAAFPILTNYLNYTFFRLQKEDEANERKGTEAKTSKKIVELDDYAAFNTGLVDKRYKPIYAFFRRTNFKIDQKWELIDFCTESDQYTGKDLVRNFNPLPTRAHYFDKPADMLYDIGSGKPKITSYHIIVERTERLPLQLLEENIPQNFTWHDPSRLEWEERKKFFKRLGAAIDKDERTFRRIENRVDDAIDLALKRVEWNFKTAIPMYYPTMNIMSLLLPLSITSEEKVDAALVVEKTKSGNYIGHTILTLQMAYNNARLVCRPDSDWLAVEKIERGNKVLEHDEDED